MQVPLSHWLRLLWGTAPRVVFDGDCAHIAAGAIHLPPHPHWQHHSAAAAHATAHLVYSPQRFDGDGLGPIARLLLALLEDARVEALAVRELPGLARLWRPLHTATPDAGVGFEGLAARLARSLSDPAYDDPHPWVRKGRALCFLDPALGIPAVRTPAELRTAATRLGHDIGQMRLPFNAKALLPLPAYRDDHRWMWAADALAEAPPPPPQSTGADTEPPDDPVIDTANATHHPEWDRLIERLRPDWCRVVETVAPEPPLAATADADADRSARTASRRLLGPVADLQRRRLRPGRSDCGDAFDLDALVDWRLGRRLRQPTPARVYRISRAIAAPAALWLLIDQSASTAAPRSSADGGALRLAARSALALAFALQARGIAFGIAAFSSNGRHAVRWRILKAFKERVDDTLVGRLRALRSEGSTRLGAVLRHAVERLGPARAGRRWVLLLSDGSPHDIDVHDAAYLVEDARRAVAGAGRKGVQMACLVFEPDGSGDATRVFGDRGAVRVHGSADLPKAVRRLIG